MTEWTAWAERRPMDPKALYRWRIPPRMICGVMLQPEWSSKLVLCGMGYDDAEYWPEGSSWNGYVRSVAKGLEWRLAEPEETEIVWHGLDLLPDPWTGKPPRIGTNLRWIAAPVYEVESFSIGHYFGTSYGWTDLNKLMQAWNQRVSGDN